MPKTTVTVFGRGLLGYHLRNILARKGYVQPNYDQLDTLDFTKSDSLAKVFHQIEADFFVNVSGLSLGMAGNLARPYDSYMVNSLLNMNLINYFITQSKSKWPKGFHTILTSCGYAPTLDPLEEKDYMIGQPHETIACHAYAKRNGFLSGFYAYQQYQFPAYSLILNNLFGPKAKYDGTGKIVEILIEKFHKAVLTNAKTVTLFGDGTQKRELLFIIDAVNMISDCIEKYNDPFEALNLGGGHSHEITLRDLANIIAETVGFKGVIFWDTTKPQGQQRKLLSVEKLDKFNIVQPVYNVRTGIEETIKWYLNNSYDYLTPYYKKIGL